MATVQETLMKMAERIKAIEKKLRQPTPDSMGGYWLSFQAWSTLPGSGNAVTNGNAFLMAIPRNMTLKKAVIPTYTATTNDASNYWSLQFTSGSGATILSGQDFHLDTPSTWTPHTYTSFDGPDILAAHVYLLLGFTKVGAPGSLFIGNPCIYFT